MSLFDHLVGEGEQVVWDGQAKCSGGLQVDYEFEFRRLHYREIGRLFTFENSDDVGAYLRIDLPANSSVTDQTAGRGVMPARVDRGQAVTRRQRGKPFRVACEEKVIADKQCPCVLLAGGRKGLLEVFCTARVKNNHPLSDGAGCFIQVCQPPLRIRIFWVKQHRNDSVCRRQFAQKPKSLQPKGNLQVGYAGEIAGRVVEPRSVLP